MVMMSCLMNRYSTALVNPSDPVLDVAGDVTLQRNVRLLRLWEVLKRLSFGFGPDSFIGGSINLQSAQTMAILSAQYRSSSFSAPVLSFNTGLNLRTISLIISVFI